MTVVENVGIFIREKVWLKNFRVLHRTYPPVKMEQAECSKTLEYKIQKPQNYPEEGHKYLFFVG